MKPINHLSRSNHRCNLLSILLYVLLQKYPRAEFFIVSLLQVIKANDFNRDGCTKNINRAVFLPKDENFFLCSSHFGKKLFQRDLKVGNIVFVSLLRQSLDDPQNFAQTVFLTDFNPCIDNISYLLKSLDKQSLFCNFYIPALTFSLLQIQFFFVFLFFLISKFFLRASNTQNILTGNPNVCFCHSRGSVREKNSNQAKTKYSFCKSKVVKVCI